MKKLVTCFILLTICSFGGIVNAQIDTATLFTLCDCCFENALSNNDTAQICANEAVKLARTFDDEDLLAKSLNDGSIPMIYGSENETAEKWLIEAYEIRERQDNQSRMGAIANKLGIVYQRQYKFEEAMKWQGIALAIFEGNGDELNYSKVANNMAVLFYNLEQIDKAKEYYLMSLDVKQGVNDSVEIGGTLTNLAGVYYDEFDYDSAVFYYEMAAQYLEPFGDNALMYLPGLYNNYGNALGHLGRFEKGGQLLEKGLALRQKMDDTDGVMKSYQAMAKQKLMADKADEALPFIEKALPMAYELERGLNIVTLWHALGEYHVLKGNREIAIEYFAKSSQAKDSIMGEDVREAVAEYEVKYETEKKEREIAQLNAENAEKELQNANQRFWIGALAAGILVILIAVILGVSVQRQKTQRKLAEQEAEFNEGLVKATVEGTEKERQRLAKELHDGAVQTVAAIKMGLQKTLRSSELPEMTVEDVKQQMGYLDSAADELRNLSHQMMPQVLLDQGLVYALEQMLSKTLGNSEIAFDFDQINVNDKRYDQSLEISIYRVCQELVNNIIKHSGAAKASIVLHQTKAYLVLQVEDNGSGFTTTGDLSGIGMSNIYSRASSVKGEVNFEGSTPSGTVATLRVPVKTA